MGRKKRLGWVCLGELLSVIEGLAAMGLFFVWEVSMVLKGMLIVCGLWLKVWGCRQKGRGCV